MLIESCGAFMPVVGLRGAMDRLPSDAKPSRNRGDGPSLSEIAEEGEPAELARWLNNTGGDSLPLLPRMGIEVSAHLTRM